MNFSYSELYRNIAPIGHVLLLSIDYDPNKWIRVCNLQDCERYASNDKEEREVLERIKFVYSKIFNGEVVGYLSTYDTPLKEIPNKWINSLNLNYFGKFDISTEGNDEKYYVTTYSFKVTSYESLPKQMFTDIAHDDIYTALSFFSPENGNVFAPYDGGVDLIINNSESFTNLESCFKLGEFDS
ncbi:hypothetical protein [uncultured Gammaproteobacteria bacterium]|jgi:hypothetical protein|nr:hypothetical protein [uncultured Gammaproteobacteria bacterium]CAC9970932.1 hypothetical protein [uncultured Gammaproteobacteria bacterium]